jgi:CBS domain-containing protein
VTGSDLIDNRKGTIMRLAEIMTKGVERVPRNETPDHASALMRMHGIHHLVVVEGRDVVGLLTSDDLRKPESASAQTVETLMTRRVVSAPPDLTVRKAANLLRGSSAGALPVIERGRLVGIVTVSDLLDLLGRGVERRVNGQRWTLRSRGLRPNAARPPKPQRR